ncbi:hypothetical protein [uncultured Roseibium sp.]|uniref:hypothetical protein n=1 Tax=uncultured Roseibium sp. TaxID=1936171 RepID=UPI0032165A5D
MFEPELPTWMQHALLSLSFAGILSMVLLTVVLCRRDLKRKGLIGSGKKSQ